MADRVIIVIMILGVIAGALFIGGGGYLASRVDTWSPRNYVPKAGDCFVPPQGDPLYDEHYAKNVNLPNCQAYLDQANAKSIEEDTRAQKVETDFGIVGGWSVVVIFAAVVLLIIFLALRG